MLEKTKTVIKDQIIESLICVDPAPMPGAGIKRIIEAVKGDLKESEDGKK